MVHKRPAHFAGFFFLVSSPSFCFAKNKYIPNSFYCEKNEMRTDVSVTIFFRMKINLTGINYTARSFWLLFSSVAVICLY